MLTMDLVYVNNSLKIMRKILGSEGNELKHLSRRLVWLFISLALLVSSAACAPPTQLGYSMQEVSPLNVPNIVSGAMLPFDEPRIFNENDLVLTAVVLSSKEVSYIGIDSAGDQHGPFYNTVYEIQPSQVLYTQDDIENDQVLRMISEDSSYKTYSTSYPIQVGCEYLFVLHRFNEEDRNPPDIDRYGPPIPLWDVADVVLRGQSHYLAPIMGDKAIIDKGFAINQPTLESVDLAVPATDPLSGMDDDGLISGDELQSGDKTVDFEHDDAQIDLDINDNHSSVPDIERIIRQDPLEFYPYKNVLTQFAIENRHEAANRSIMVDASAVIELMKANILKYYGQ